MLGKNILCSTATTAATTTHHRCIHKLSIV